MKRARGLVGALLLSAAGGWGCNGGLDGQTAALCAWSGQAPELKLPVSEVQGVLRGASRNASTTCTRQKGAGGPEAIYALRVTERSLIELEAVSTIDTVIAVRRACDDPLTELACNDSPLGGDAGVPGGRPVDASPVPFPPPPAQPRDGGPADGPRDSAPPPSSDGGAALAQIATGNSRDAHLRVVLDPGTYYVVIDEAEAFGVGGDYLLRVSASPPLAQTSCNTAYPIQDGVSLPVEELDLGTELAPSCTGDEKRPALYYRAIIPSGQRLTVRALATAGDRPFTPVLQLLTACGQSACLGANQVSPDGVQRLLRYVNNGPTDLPVLLSMGANTAVTGATARLDVTIGEPLFNVTCASARALTDGEVLRNQDVSQGQASSASPCGVRGASSLFYRANLLPQQSLRVTATTRLGATPFNPVQLLLHQACGDVVCGGSMGERVEYTNTSSSARTVILEAAGFPGSGPTAFELDVSMPPPPARIAVTPTHGLQTTEAGGQATFTVALASPPRQPVVIALTSSDPAEGEVSPAEVAFDASNWQTARTVTVTGADDGAKDGARPYRVQVGPATGDERYIALTAIQVSLLNRDDEPGFHLEARAPLATTEAGGRATFTVALNRAPTAPVRLALGSSDEGEGTVAPAELVFQPETWSQPQTVTITGVDDQDDDGPQPYRVVTGPAASDDPQYAGVDPEDPEARNADNELVRVAAKVVSGGLSCQANGVGRRLAVDEAGNLYAGMACSRPFGQVAVARPAGSVSSSDAGAAAPLPPSSSVFVATSADGGQTFGPPVDARLPVFEAAIAAGPPGVVVVAGAGPQGVLLARSADGGATWSAPRVLSGGGSSVRLAAAGNTVLASADTPSGPTLWISQDAGLSFETASAPAGLMDVGVDPAGVIWVLTFDGRLIFHQSGDGGATFDGSFIVAEGIEGFFEVFAVSATTIFGTGGDSRLLVQARDRSTRRVLGGLLSGQPRTLACDERDNLFVLEAVSGTVQVRRLPAGAEAFEPARAIGLTHAFPAAVALADSAVAVSLMQSGQVLVAVETFP